MEAELSIIAKKRVLQGFQNSEDILSRASALEVHLNDVFCCRQPTALDYDNRRDLIRILNEIAKEIYGNNNECPVVEGFGSFVMDMFSAKSDLDLSINFNDKNIEARRDVKIKALRKFANKFYSLQKKKHVTNVQTVLSARVPVLKVTDCGTGIECDLSVGNNDGIAKSHTILMISSIDERFKKLCFLLKAWAKAHDINSSKDGTLNSLSLILLAAFHLQTREPPILPPFSAIYKDGIDPQVSLKKNIPTFSNYGSRNKESLASLFVSLLVMLESVETLWGMGLCASTYEGSWIYKTWASKKGDTIGLISVEDFTDRSQNTARAVKIQNLSKILPCIRYSIQHIRSFTSGKIDARMLMNQLFGPDALAEYNGIKSIAHPIPNQQPNVQVLIQGKRKRAKEKREKKKSKKKLDKSAIIGGAQAQAQAPPLPNPPVHSSVGLRDEAIVAEVLIQGKRKRAKEKREKKQSKKKLDKSAIIGGAQAQAPPLPIPPVHSSVGLRNEAIHAEVSRYSNKKPDRSSTGGAQAHVPSHPNPPLHSNPPGAQAHVPSHPNPPSHSNPPALSSVGFRNERSHAEIWSYPSPNRHHHHHHTYRHEHHPSFASTSGSAMPFHTAPYVPHPVPYFPHLVPERAYSAMPCHTTHYVPHPVPYVPYLVPERAYSASQPLPFLGPDYRNSRGFGSYNTSVETNRQPNPSSANGAYPSFISRPS